MICPLCSADNCPETDGDTRRTYHCCSSCTLVFVPEKYHYTKGQERKRYDLHDNTTGNKGYVRFLGEVAGVIANVAAPEARILDFGCGEKAVLTGLLRKRGGRCDCYDPLYDHSLPDSTVRYDVIVLCEVIEHLRNLRDTLNTIDALLKNDGLVLVRTRCYPETEKLTKWWYAQDMTHINFFSSRALEVAAGFIRRRFERTSFEDIFLFCG